MTAISLLFLVKGILVGLAISAPVGAIGTICIRQSIIGGFIHGFAAGLGAATADGIYGAIAAYSLTILTQFLLSYQKVLTILGGIFLLYIGTKTFYAPALKTPAGAKRQHPLTVYITTLFLTLTNPITIISFTALFSAFNVTGQNYQTALLFVLGVFLGSALWWLFLSSLVSLVRARLKPSFITGINKISGAFIALFGLLALVRSIYLQ